MSPIVLTPVHLQKAWGFETIFCNNEEFCGKELTILAGRKFSIHFHRDKREVFWVREGNIILRNLNTEDATCTGTCYGPESVIEIPRLCPHQIEAVTDAKVVEFSTHHEDSDSYRVAPGDSQK